MAREFNPTPGGWQFIEGEPGFMGSLEEPPEPATPPMIVVESEVADLEIAELRDPRYHVEPDPNDSWDEGERYLGDAESNGRLMTAAPDLLKAAERAERLLSRLIDYDHFEEDGRTGPRDALRDAIAKAKGLDNGRS